MLERIWSKGNTHPFLVGMQTCSATVEISVAVFEWHLVPVCSFRVMRKVAETMPTAQWSLPGQVVESGLLGVHKQENLGIPATIHSYFQAMQCAASWI